MTDRVHEVLVAVLLFCGVFLPGNIARWVRYREWGDVLALLACLALAGAAAWHLWGERLLGASGVDTWILILVVLWCVAAAFVGLAFIQTQVVEQKHYRARVSGKSWWERALYTLGWVEFGHHPEDVRRVVSKSKAHKEDVGPRRIPFPSLLGGAVLCFIGIAGLLLSSKNTGGRSLFTYSLTFGILLLVGGALDGFVVSQRGRKRQSSGDLTRCAYCGYSLHGLPERRCPECGNSF